MLINQYKRVLKSEDEIKDLNKYKEVPLICPHNRLPILHKILYNEQSGENYWNLVWSTAFTTLAEKKQQDSTEKFTLNKAAAEAKVPTRWRSYVLIIYVSNLAKSYPEVLRERFQALYAQLTTH